MPHLLDELCDHVNARTGDAHHGAAYVLWRLNWIHPFAPDGNGRTARAVAMIVLFSRLGVEPVARADQPSFLEVLGWRKLACYDALEAGDAAWARGQLDVTALEELLAAALIRSLAGEESP